MSYLSAPQFLAELRITRYPASLGTNVIRAAKRPVSLPNAFFQPRLDSIVTIERSATDQDGNAQIGSATVVLNDQDGELAELLEAGTDTEFWVAREMILYAPSQEMLDSRPVIADLQPVFRGWITEVQWVRRQVTVTAADCVGSLMSASNLDRKVLQIQHKNLTSTPTEETKDEYLPIYLGEYSDKGSTNSEGASAARGLLPVREVCEIDITDITGTPVPVFAAPPVITASSVTGASGQQSISYGATLITPFGESSMSNIVTCNGASVRNVSNYNEISGTFDNGDPLNPNKVRIWFGPSPDNMVGWLDEANYNGTGIFGYFDGAAAWPVASRDELDWPKYMTAPAGNNAQTNENIFSIMRVCLGYGYQIRHYWGSDLAEGVAPRRAEIDPSERGVTTIGPDDAEWPFPNPWIEMNDIKFTGFLQRGHKLLAHRDGSVTMAVDLAGPFDDDGNLIDQAFPQLQFMFNEHGLRNKGTGYRNHIYNTLETYDDGTSLIKTSTASECQDQTKIWLGDDVGYQANVHVIDPNDTWRDVVQKSCQSFGVRMMPNRFGQIEWFFIPTSDDGYLGRHYREKIEIKRTEDPSLSYDQIVNSILLNYFYDPDAGDFRGKALGPFIEAESIAAMVPGGIVGSTDTRGERPLELNCYYSNYQATVYDVVYRELLRRRRRVRYPSITVPMLGIDFDIGDRGRLTDSLGLGRNGDQATRIIILKHTIHPDDEEVTYSLLDLTSVQTGISATIGDESSSPVTADEVGDEESTPPTAVEIG